MPLWPTPVPTMQPLLPTIHTSYQITHKGKSRPTPETFGGSSPAPLFSTQVPLHPDGGEQMSLASCGTLTMSIDPSHDGDSLPMQGSFTTHICKTQEVSHPRRLEDPSGTGQQVELLALRWDYGIDGHSYNGLFFQWTVLHVCELGQAGVFHGTTDPSVSVIQRHKAECDHGDVIFQSRLNKWGAHSWYWD